MAPRMAFNACSIRAFALLLKSTEINYNRAVTVYSYIRLTTGIDERACRKRVMGFVMDNKLGKVEFVTEPPTVVKEWGRTELGRLADMAKEGDLVVVPDLMMFSKSLIQLCAILEALHRKGVWISALEQKFTMTGDKSEFNQGIVTALQLVSGFERALISSRMKQALALQRSRGARLGRPVGSGKSLLDPYKDEILAARARGVAGVALAEKYGTTPQNFSKWLKKNTVSNRAVACQIYCVGDSGEAAQPDMAECRGASDMITALVDYARKKGLKNYLKSDVMLGDSYIFIADSEQKQGFILSWPEGRVDLEEALVAEGVGILM